MRFVLLMCCLLLSSPAFADVKDQIVGTWKLVSVMYEDQQTKELTPVLGQNPKGSQIATPEGRWLALVTAEGRKVPQTDEERAQALRSMRTTKSSLKWKLPGMNPGWVASRCASSDLRATSCTSRARPCRIRMSAAGLCA